MTDSAIHESSQFPRPKPSSDEPRLDLSASMELIQRHKEGEGDALEQLIERYQKRLRAMARRNLRGGRMRDQLESVDIVQEVNIVMMNKLADLEIRDSESLRNWLYKVVQNKIRGENQRARAQKRDVDRNVPIETGTDSVTDGVRLPADERASRPFDRAWRREVRGIMRTALRKLSPDHREVIVQRDYKRHGWKEITVTMKRPSVAATQELHRRAWTRLHALTRSQFGDLDE